LFPLLDDVLFRRIVEGLFGMNPHESDFALKLALVVSVSNIFLDDSQSGTGTRKGRRDNPVGLFAFPTE
jgi:hypothetical protein